MHLEDATRFCPKDERESEQTSFSDQNPRQDQKGGFRSSFRKLFKKKWALIQQDQCSRKKRKSGHRYTQRKDHVKTQGEERHLQAKQRGLRNQSCQHLDLGHL
uniref:Rho guanine nucleotide exchange factor 33 n=1 Tax=Equus caballus TaxID=9796 RepID=A0A9L0RJM1_HORSE